MQAKPSQKSGFQFLFLIAGLSAPILSTAQVTLHYNERPPYMVSKDGQLTGLTGSPAVAAFKAAGIAFTLNSTPSTRQLITIKENTGSDCGVGWFKNAEREAFGKFTKPIYQDKPQIALTAAGNTKVKGGETVESVLGNKDITLLVKQAYSYGKTLDALIAKLQPKQNSVTVESVQMLQMIHAGRADYMFMAPEEADGLISAGGINPAEIRKASFSNAPNGEDRYIMCSKTVPDETIAKLNSAIK
jgi:polar amino acid transport system substrate-binding protein